MKLLLVTYGLNTVGGVQHWQHLFSHKMLELGHEVTILEMYDYSETHMDKRFERVWSPLIRIIKHNGPIVQRGVNKHTNFAAARVVVDLYSKIRLAKFLNEGKFDSIIFTDPNFTFFFLEKTLVKNNCFVQFHSSFERFKSTSRLRYFLTKRKHRIFKKFIFLSHGDCQEAIKNGFSPKVVDYIYNFIDEKKFEINESQKIKRQKRILFVGNLDNPDKQVDHLFKAVGMIGIDVIGDWKVWIIGDGSNKMRLMNMASNLGIGDHVEFFGQINNPSKYFFESSLYIISSSFEGGPLTLLECLFSNLPVISYKCSPFIQEVIIDNVTGSLVENNDIIQLAASIEYFISNPEAIELMSENIKRIKNKYSSKEILKKWIDKMSPNEMLLEK